MRLYMCKYIYISKNFSFVLGLRHAAVYIQRNLYMVSSVSQTKEKNELHLGKNVHTLDKSANHTQSLCDFRKEIIVKLNHRIYFSIWRNHFNVNTNRIHQNIYKQMKYFRSYRDRMQNWYAFKQKDSIFTYVVFF